MSVETGIAPQALIDLEEPLFNMMIKVLKERAKEANGGNTNPRSLKTS